MGIQANIGIVTSLMFLCYLVCVLDYGWRPCFPQTASTMESYCFLIHVLGHIVKRKYKLFLCFPNAHYKFFEDAIDWPIPSGMGPRMAPPIRRISKQIFQELIVDASQRTSYTCSRLLMVFGIFEILLDGTASECDVYSIRRTQSTRNSRFVRSVTNAP